MEKLLNSDQNAKTAYNTELIIDQNKLLKNRLDQVYKQSIQKDQEISILTSRQADYEKRIVLLQKQAKDSKLLRQMNEDAGINQNHIKSLMMPFSSSANINRSNFGTNNGFAPQGFGGFNTKVVKPIRGGGKGGKQNDALNFSEFMNK